MRVLLDTNVLLDFLLAREPFASDARGIWLACEQGRCTGYLAAISVTNIWYIGRKSVGMEAARQHVADLLRVIEVCPVDFEVLATARDSAIADFEDAVQVAAAVASGLDAIVTRNGGHFAGSPLPILTPAEFLAQLSATPSTGASTAEEPAADNDSGAWDVEL
jgi:predicted nucleic acid-binding protein